MRGFYGAGSARNPHLPAPGRDGKIVDIVVGYMQGEAILDAALAKAGVSVDPALIAKGAADLKRRAVLSGEAPIPAKALVAPKAGD